MEHTTDRPAPDPDHAGERAPDAGSASRGGERSNPPRRGHGLGQPITGAPGEVAEKASGR